jgi:hypothetical protein
VVIVAAHFEKSAGAMLFQNQLSHSENPDVFYYQVLPDPDVRLVRLTFCRGFTIYILGDPWLGPSSSQQPSSERQH